MPQEIEVCECYCCPFNYDNVACRASDEKFEITEMVEGPISDRCPLRKGPITVTIVLGVQS